MAKNLTTALLFVSILLLTFVACENNKKNTSENQAINTETNEAKPLKKSEGITYTKVELTAPSKDGESTTQETSTNTTKSRDLKFDSPIGGNNHRVIFIGSGGGITGLEMEYQITDIGKIIQSNSNTRERVELKSFNAKQMEKINFDFNSLKIDDISLDDPYNRYYFLGYHRGNKTHKITWGNPKNPAPEKVLNFYEDLMKKIQENNK